MACIDKRTYLNLPIEPGFAQMPDVPKNQDDWLTLLKFLRAVKDTLEGTSPNNVVTPFAIKNFAMTVTQSGVKLTWDADKNSAFYVIFRNTNNNFQQSRIVCAMYADSGQPSFFDVGNQEEPGTPRYYWIRGYGPTGAAGPLVGPFISVDPGIVDTLFLPNETRQRQIAAISAFDSAAAPSATDTGTNIVTIGTAKNWPDGTRVTVNATASGLTTATNYYLHRHSSTTFSFHTNVDDAYDDANKVDLTGNVTATITPNALVFCTIPEDAHPTSIVSTRNEGEDGDWFVRTGGTAPTSTVYSWKLGPGDPVLGTLGEAFTEENPPIGDVCVFHEDEDASGAGVIACYAAWNDGTSAAVGPTGLQGEQGIQGETGPQGDNAEWFSGEGSPDSSEGDDGDFYLDTDDSTNGPADFTPAFYQGDGVTPLTVTATPTTSCHYLIQGKIMIITLGIFGLEFSDSGLKPIDIEIPGLDIGSLIYDPIFAGTWAQIGVVIGGVAEPAVAVLSGAWPNITVVRWFSPAGTDLQANSFSNVDAWPTSTAIDIIATLTVVLS